MQTNGAYSFTYKNWKGEISERRIQFHTLEYGTTKWHPTPQWFVTAWDFEKNDVRWFALADIDPSTIKMVG